MRACTRRVRCGCASPTPGAAARSRPSSSTPPAAWPAATASTSTSRSAPARALTVTTAAAEKIYRSLGPDTSIDVKLDVGAGGALAWLPQETILFDQMRLARTIDVELARGASLLLAEAVVFGRSAMGEAVMSGSCFDRWRVRRRWHARLRRDHPPRRRDRAAAGGARHCRRRRRYRQRPQNSGRRGRRRGGSGDATAALPVRSAYPPGTGSRSRGWSPPTARRCTAISSAY